MPAIACPTARPELVRGSIGADVTELQKAINRRLIAQGIATSVLRVPVTGEFGPLTEQAVKYLQCLALLNVDGVVGPRTWGFLCNGADALPRLSFGDSSVVVSRLQETLKGLGVYAGPITGFYGELTETAVRNYQRNTTLAVTGTMTAATWEQILRGKIQGGTCYRSIYG